MTFSFDIQYNMKDTSLLSIPPELQWRIIGFLNDNDKAAIMSSCKAMQQTVHSFATHLKWQLLKNITADLDGTILKRFLLVTSIQIKGKMEDHRLNDLGALSALPKLRSISCYNTIVSSLVPLASLSELSALDLSCCKHVVDLSPLASLHRLSKLDLSDCQSLIDLSPLASLFNLSRLDLAGCALVEDLSSLSNLTNLQVLCLSDASISNLGPLSAMVQMVDLDLNETDVSDLSPLRSMTRMETLRIGFSEVTDLRWAGQQIKCTTNNA